MCLFCPAERSQTGMARARQREKSRVANQKVGKKESEAKFLGEWWVLCHVCKARASSAISSSSLSCVSTRMKPYLSTEWCASTHFFSSSLSSMWSDIFSMHLMLSWFFYYIKWLDNFVVQFLGAATDTQRERERDNERKRKSKVEFPFR